MRGPGADSHPGPLLLEAFVDHEATPAEALHVAQHLAGCAPCAARRDDVLALSHGIESLPGLDVPDGFSAAVMGRVAALPAPRRAPRLLRLAAPAVAILAGLAALAASPWPLRLAQGVGRLLPRAPSAPGEVLDLILAFGTAALATLGRAAQHMGPWAGAPGLSPGGGPSFPWSLAVLYLALSATVMGLALAGGGLLRLWSLWPGRPPRRGD